MLCLMTSTRTRRRSHTSHTHTHTTQQNSHQILHTLSNQFSRLSTHFTKHTNTLYKQTVEYEQWKCPFKPRYVDHTREDSCDMALAEIKRYPTQLHYTYVCELDDNKNLVTVELNTHQIWEPIVTVWTIKLYNLLFIVYTQFYYRVHPTWYKYIYFIDKHTNTTHL